MLGKPLMLGIYDEVTNEPRVKVANLNELEDFIGGLQPDPGYMYLHVIAMGAGEFYGCNKNGDYFPERSLLMYHHTFVQNAKVYKEHNNKADSPSYGRIAKSWYNPKMHRVELILAIDRDKGKDIVTAVEDRGQQLEVSMGCRVPYDVCSICGNKASKKADYCHHISHENKKVYADGRQAYMLNLQPTFFDISVVRRRADKIAFALRKVANEVGDIDHVYDWVEKTADVEKEVPVEAVVKVLNKGMFNMLPKLEAVEPDLPAPMLDRIATRHSLPDILQSFLYNMVPLKPAEFTRIIIVQNGFPMNWFNPLLGGVMSARPGTPPLGEYQPEIGELLEKFLPQRSSYGPHVVKRVIMIKEAAEKTAAENANQPPRDYPFYDPAYLNELNKYQHSYSTLPVTYSPEEYHLKQKELAAQLSQPLRKPLNPFAVGLILGALYGGYRSADKLKDLVNLVASNKGVALGGLAALGIAKALTSGAQQDPEFRKTAGWKSGILLPFVGAHLASAHYRRKYYQGEQLNGVEKFIAENPDYLSIAAPFAMHFANKKLSPFLGKTAGSYDEPQEDNTKLADFSDVLTNSAIQGIIFRGRGISSLGNMSDMILDNTLMNKATQMITKKQEPETQTHENQV